MRYKFFPIKTFHVRRKWYREHGGYAYGQLALIQNWYFHILPSLKIGISKEHIEIELSFMFWELKYSDECGICILNIGKDQET